MRKAVQLSLAATALFGFLGVQALANEADASDLPAGCSYEGSLGFLDFALFDNPAEVLAARAGLPEAQRRGLEMHDYAMMVISKAAELNPGFSGKPRVRSMAISGEIDRKQADVEVTVEWRSGEEDEISGRAVIGATKCGEGRGRVTTISLEFIPQDHGDATSPISVKPALAQKRSRQIQN